MGISTLLHAASERAREHGMLVLTAVGVQSEANLPFAGPHQLLRPILGRAGELPAPQRDALHAAFGWTDAAAPDLALVARRLESEPVALLIAIREGYESSLDEAGQAELRLEGLDEADASGPPGGGLVGLGHAAGLIETERFGPT